jgi:multiple antibiotic resistance protein
LVFYQALGPELLAAIVTLFVILDPIGTLPFFMTLTRSATPEQRAKLANKAVLIAMILLLVFALLGDVILLFLGINIADFEIAGGGLLLLFALRDALSAEPLGLKSSTAQSNGEPLYTTAVETVAVIPIATPLLAGPGSLTTVMLLARENYGILVSAVAILVDCSIAWVFFHLSARITKIVGDTGLLITGKVLDILMAAIAVSFLTQGITSIFHV